MSTKNPGLALGELKTRSQALPPPGALGAGEGGERKALGPEKHTELMEWRLNPGSGAAGL